MCWKANSGTTYTTLGTVFTTSYTATGLTPATAYMFRVTPITEGFVGTSSGVTGSKTSASCSGFSGTLQVGSSGNFATIKAAIDSFKNVGFSGNVILELQSSYSSSSEVFPITIPDFRTNLCNGTNSQLIIRPASGASNLIISGNNATALFILDNAYKVTFDGRAGGSGTSRQLHIHNTNSAGTVFTIQNDAIGNTIRYCNIRSANTNSASGAIFIGGTTKFFGNDSNVISNNMITKAASSTLATGITSTGTANVFLQNDNNSILNNEIHSWTSFGVNVTATVGNGPNWNISNNSFYDSATSTSTAMTAINFVPGTTSNSMGNTISGNFIGGSAANAGGSAWTNSSAVTFTGILVTCNPGSPTLVQNNIIQNINLSSSSSTANFTGINPTGGSVIVGGAAGKGNTIGHASASNSISSAGGSVLIGISGASANDVVFSYNTIANISQNNSSLTTGAIRGIVNTSGSSVYINNNTIKSLSTNSGNTGTNSAASVLGISMQSGSANQQIMDNIVGNGNSEALSNTNTSASTCVAGIVNTGGITLIKGNKINGLANSSLSTGVTTGSALTGIYLSGTNGCVIDRNEIRNLNATGSAASQAQGIYINSGSTDISNNIISGINTTSTSTGTSTSAAVVGINYNTGLPATIKNNTIENVNATASSGSEIIGIQTASTLTYIQNNIIRHLYSNSSSTTTTLTSILGISITPATVNKIVTGNKIYNFYNYNSSAASTITGIYMTNASAFGNNSLVNNNFIHSFKLATSGVGILTGIYAGSGIVTYQNNMIRLGIDSTGNAVTGPYNVKGIVHAATTSSNYYNNSVYLAGSSSGSTNTACIDFLSAIATPDLVNMKNNIFYNAIVNSSGGINACIRVTSVSGRILSNHNILYAPNKGGAIGIVGTTGYTTLTGSGGWNSVFLMDGQSGTVDPNFLTPNGTSSTVDLHLSSSTPAENAGDPTVAVVTDDFDGQLRSSFTPTDIGADAGNFTKANDKFPPIINLTPLTNTTSTGDRTFTANIIDNGTGLPFSSSNAPRVYYKKGSGTLYSAAGTLTAGNRQNGTWSFTISASTMGGVSATDVINYYLVAQDSAVNVVSNPMYAIASSVTSISTDPTTPLNYTIAATLSTTINVGTGQTYTSLTATGSAGLFNAINTSGLQGNTIVEITSDLSETGAVALNQWTETGGSNYTLTIRPSAATRRTVSGSGSSGMIRLNGADRVKITGIPASGSTADTFLFIKCTNADASIALLNDAVNNTFENCVIEAATSITPSNPPAVLLSATGITTGNDNNSFIRCHIRAINGTGLGNAIQSLGQTPTALLPLLVNDNITIRECHFNNFTTSGITVAANGAGNNWRILNNHFYRSSTTAASATQTAINFIPGIISNNDTISGNFIGGSAGSCGGAAWTNSGLVAFNGINISAGIESVTQVQNNTIKNLSFTATGTLATLFTGINITGGHVDVGSVIGNKVGDASTSNSIQTSGDAGLIGINSTTAYKLNVSNNTVANLTAAGGTVYTSTAVRGIILSSGTLELNVINNVVKNLTATSRSTGSTTGAAVVGIGIGSSGNIQNILNNTVQNLKNPDNVGAHCMVGIVTTSGVNIIKGNTISGLVSGTAQTAVNATNIGIAGMMVTGNLSGSEFSNNSISDLQYTSSAPAAVQMIGLFIPSGSGFKIANNTISSLNSMSTLSGSTTSSAIMGISYPGSVNNLIITGNTIHSLNHNNSSTSAAISITGIYFLTNSSPIATGTVFNTISRNFIHSFKLSTTGVGAMYGIYTAGTAGNNGSSTVAPVGAGGWLLLENNMVRLGIDSSGNGFSGPHNIYGIYQSYNNVPVMYYHNSLYVGGSPSSGSSVTAALAIPTAYTLFGTPAIPASAPNQNTSTQVMIKNNILVNAISNTGSASGKNYALKLGGASYIVSNYNILQASGTGGITAGTTVDYTNLKGASSWQMGTGLDLNSGSGSPGFVNATGRALAVDLHLSSSNPAEGNGTTDVTTTVDFDGNNRSARTPVDIGASSGNYTLSPDIISPSISYNQLNNSSSTSGTKTLANVSITDNAGIPMTGSSIPRIYFSKNNSTWYSSAATSLTGSSKNAVASFDITYSTMGGVSLGDTIRYYVIAQDNAGNIMSNGLYAVASDVNTITSHPTVPNSYKLVPALAAGTKLRVGTGKTYPTLTGPGGLFEYLNSIALNGNVTAVISSNTTEPGIVALKQLGDNGSGTYTVTIQPDSLTTTERLLSGNIGLGMIRFDGADRVKFTGVPDFNGTSSDKKLRFRNSSTSGSVFLFINEAVDNRLNNLNMESSNSSVAQGACGVVQFGTSTRAKGNSRDTVSNCVLGYDKSGVLPLGVPAIGIHSFGDQGKENTANVIMGNEITNYSQYGIWLGNTGNGNNWSVVSNSFYWNMPFAAFTIQYGIFLDVQTYSGGHNISNNFIGGSAKNCGGAPWVTNINDRLRGISITSASTDLPSNISNNTIQNIRLINVASPNAFIGIAIITIGNFNIINNQIGHPTDINSIVVAGAGASIGILTQSAHGCNIRGNKIQGMNFSTPGVASSFLGISLFYGVNTAVKNTIGSTTVANSIQYAGAGANNSGIYSQIALAVAPTVVIDSNIIANYAASGLESGVTLKGIYNIGTATATITNNTIYNLSVNSSSTAISPPSAVSGISSIGSTLGGVISYNTISGIRANNTGNVATSANGIGITSGNNIMIANNRIFDIINLSTNTNINAPATAVGINIASPQNVVTMQNNQISLGTGQNNSPMFIGIWHQSSGNFIVNSYFNSVYIGGTASSGALSSYGYLRGNNFVSSSYTSIVNAKNNIFINDRKGGTGKHYTMGNQNIITTFQTGWLANASNYNFLANSSAYPMGLWNISDYNFSDWKLNSGSDLNSIYMETGTSGGQVNPANLFQNTATGNLSLIKSNSEASLVAGKGIPISGVTTDFDNVVRDASTPTIGSSEVSLSDLGVTAITAPANNSCGKASTSITVTVKNFGLKAQSNIPISVTGTGSATFNFSGTLAGPLNPGASASHTFTGTFNSSAGGTYTLKSFTSLSGDGSKSNDTTSATITLLPLPKPAFTYTDTCAGRTTGFTSTSTVSGGTITSNTWRFGDGSNGSGNTTTHAYAGAGTSYNVKIISTSNSGCTDSATKAISILSNLVAGVVGTDQTICFNSAPALLTSTSSASGSLSPYTYQWQQSSDNVTFTDISGATSLTYQPGTLSTTMYYRRSAKTTSGCGPANSNVVKITVNTVLNPGVIGSGQTICIGGTGSALTFSTAPTGAFGTYTYQWQMSTDSVNWSNISGQTSSSFTPSGLSVATFYRVTVTSGACTPLMTNAVKIKLFAPITGGTIASGQTICVGNTPAALTQVSAPTGGPGTYSFQWQSSTDSINWSNISGATSSGFAPSALSVTTYFQRLAQSSGCPSGTSNALKIRTNPKPTVSFTATDHCFNDQMPLTNSSSISSGTLTYLWNFGDGTTSTSSVPNKTYTSSGTYSVMLTATSNLGCKDSLTKSVLVATTPIPAFAFTLKCQGDSVIFSDQTVYACGSSSGISYLWNFGDGTTSTVRNARHHYNSSGTYNVKFKLSFPGGYKDSITKSVVFNIRSVPSFTATNNCFPLATSFTNSSTNFSTLAWSFGDATTSSTTSSSFTKTYSAPGNYSVKLVSTSSFGCKDSVVKTVSVFAKPVAGFSAANNCVGFATSFSNSSSGAVSYSWDFGDATSSTNVNPTHTYSSAGAYSVKLVVLSANGCRDSMISSVNVYSNPVAGFTTSNVCRGTLSSFTNTSTGASTYSWNFGNGNSSALTNPTYTYPTAGTYTVTLTATTSNGCTNSTSQSYTVNGSPTAGFTASNACIGTSIAFSNTSSGASTNLWNFGDATTSSLASPSKSYSASGTYNVKLSITNSFGCKDSVTRSVVVFAKPTVGFAATNQCLGTAISFTNQTTGASSYVWDFGNGQTSAGTSPNYVYPASGTYNVKLVAVSSNGCKDSLIKSVTVFSNPTVSFTASPNPVCRGGQVSFTNTTAGGATYRWTFGNGNTSTLTSPTNIYTTTGNFNVKLVSSSSNGCKDSTIRTVTVWPRPVASFSVNNGCTNDNLSFATNSAGAVAHAWTFGDATGSSLANPSKAYSSAGTYSVRLIVTSLNGCMDTTTSNVVVYPRATASFTSPGNFCVGTGATFTNTSSLSSGTMTHQWSFGNGATSSSVSPVYTYPSAGTYTVTLSVTTDKGCVNTNTATVTVYPKPVANFNAAPVCQGLAATFNNTSTGGVSYSWDFGDAGNSTSMSPTHTYSAAGVYNVKLTVTNSNNCTDVITLPVTVYPAPTANFTATDRCIGQAVQFTNSSTGASDVFWQFGDGNSSNSASPLYNYAKSGIYNVTLNVESINGCIASVTKTVNVFAAPKASFSVNNPSQCVNTNSFVFTDNSSISSGSFTRNWAFGDGSNSSLANPVKNYATSGSYNVKLVVTGNNGCKDSAMDVMMVRPKPVANFNINNPTQCLNGNLFNFSDNSTISDGSSLTRLWENGGSTGGLFFIHRYDAPGTYNVKLTVSSDFGCSDNITRTVTVNPSPSASFTPSSTIQCLNGNAFNFTNTSSGAVFTSAWKLGDGSTATSANASKTYATAGNYRVSLTVTTSAGCKDSAYYMVKVLGSPANLTITGPTTAPQKSKQTYSVPFTQGSSYNWVVVNGTLLSNGANMVQVIWNATGVTGNISVTETSSAGCPGNPASSAITLYDATSVGSIHRNEFAASIYPSPTKGAFTVEVSRGNQVEMNIYDQAGRLVMAGVQFNNSVTITEHNLAVGVYTVKLSDDKGKISILRFEVQN